MIREVTNKLTNTQVTNTDCNVSKSKVDSWVLEINQYNKSCVLLYKELFHKWKYIHYNICTFAFLQSRKPYMLTRSPC